MEGKFLGKIKTSWFGFRDNDPSQDLGLTVDLQFGSGGAGDFVDLSGVRKLMRDAGITDVTKLLGKPIEVSVKGNVLQSWRILTEVL
jgi:hypothetical protein